jgi:DNA polymerase III alpha subunit (gram-positive type)
MGYKINIRNAANNDWVNLLQDQYVVHDYTTTGIGTSATDNVELALKSLFDNKIE